MPFEMAYIVVLSIALSSAFFLLYAIRKREERKWGKCKNNVKLIGRVVVITGANSGIGYETAKEMARRGAHVVLACRDSVKADQAIENIRMELNTNANLRFLELNLSSFESINIFSEEMNTNYNTIDILINNAGVSYPKSKLITSEGLEVHMGVNYFGHVHLTNSLLGLLKNSDRPRIINVTSTCHEKISLNLESLNYESRRIKHPYAESKLALCYYGQALARRNEDINVYNVSPGWVNTNLFRYHKISFFYYLMALPVAFLYMRTRRQGAETVIYCATEPTLDLESGQFYRNCTKYRSDYQFNNDTRMQLWDRTNKTIQDIQENM